MTTRNSFLVLALCIIKSSGKWFYTQFLHYESISVTSKTRFICLSIQQQHLKIVPLSTNSEIFNNIHWKALALESLLGKAADQNLHTCRRKASYRNFLE